MTDINHDGAAALISREFSNLYKNDWHRARESLRETKSEEEIIYILLRIVRAVYDYCSELESSNSDISEKNATEDFIEHRLPKGFEKAHLTKELNHFIHICMLVTRKMCSHTPPLWIHWQPKGDEINKDMFHCDVNASSVVDWTVWPALLDETGAILSKGTIIPDFIEHRLPKGFEKAHLTKELNHFIHICMLVTRKMCSHTPPLWIHWQPKGDEINKDMFHCDVNASSVVDWTVWPALLDETGAILSKGTIIPVT